MPPISSLLSGVKRSIRASPPFELQILRLWMTGCRCGAGSEQGSLFRGIWEVDGLPADKPQGILFGKLAIKNKFWENQNKISNDSRATAGCGHATYHVTGETNQYLSFTIRLSPLYSGHVPLLDQRLSLWTKTDSVPTWVQALMGLWLLERSLTSQHLNSFISKIGRITV